MGFLFLFLIVIAPASLTSDVSQAGMLSRNNPTKASHLSRWKFTKNGIFFLIYKIGT
jgi:hypothetical protein